MDLIKLNALKIRRRAALSADLYGVLFFISLTCAAVFLTVSVLCVFYSPAAVFDGYPLFVFFHTYLPDLFITAALFSAAALNAVFAASFYFARRAAFYYAADTNQRRPSRFISFKTGVKTLYCGIRIALLKSGLAAALFAPAAVNTAFLYFLLNGYGLTPAVFYTGLAVGAALFAAGATGFFILKGRYSMSLYLIYLNPLLKVKDALRSGALLCEGKLLFSAIVNLRLFPWLLISILILPLHFSTGYRAAVRAALCEKLYGEDKTKVISPAVVFYVGKDTKIAVSR